MTDRAQPLMRDAKLIETKALPAAAETIYTDGIDLGLMSARGAFLPKNCEVSISTPALTTGELPDAQTLIFDVQCDADILFGTPRTLAKEVLLVTGAGGVGAAAAAARFRLPTDVEQYLRVAATKSGVGSAAAKEVTAELLF